MSLNAKPRRTPLTSPDIKRLDPVTADRAEVFWKVQELVERINELQAAKHHCCYEDHVYKPLPSPDDAGVPRLPAYPVNT